MLSARKNVEIFVARHVPALALLAGAALAVAQPGTPVYTNAWTDCRTDDNRYRGCDGAFYWDVDAGCDIYQQDVYERPVTQAFELCKKRFGAKEYFEYLDILSGRAGHDDKFLYIGIDLRGRNHRTSDGSIIPVGLVERYGFRLSVDPDGRHGFLIVSDQPELKNKPKTKWGRIGTFGYFDANGDVGGASDGPTGLTVTKSDNPDEEDGMNGYEQVIISDGRMSDDTTVLWVRINPLDKTMVELALDFGALGLTQEDLANLGNLEFEAIKGGAKDPQNYRWNDKYTKAEAGSPNKGSGGLSEFGTEGCKDIYEVDTLRGMKLGLLPGDLNGDGELSILDIADFHLAFSSGLPAADFNGDGLVEAEDAIAFLTAHTDR